VNSDLLGVCVKSLGGVGGGGGGGGGDGSVSGRAGWLGWCRLEMRMRLKVDLLECPLGAGLV